MGRPVEYTEKRISTAVRFSPELYARLKEVAKDREVSMNWLVNKAVEDFLDRLIPVDEMVWTRSNDE